MKIFKLFINENIKIWKKLSTKILIIAILLSLIGVLGLVKLMQHMEEKAMRLTSVVDTSDEYLKSEIEYFKEQLKNEDLDEQSRQSIQMQLEQYELYLEYDINLYGSTWKNEIVVKVVELRQNGQNDEAEKLIKMLKESDYSGYIETQKQILKMELTNKEIEQQEYDDEMLILELKEKYEIGKNEEEDYWKTSIIREIQQSKTSIRNGINQNTRKVLKTEEKQELEDLIKIDIYRLEHNIEPAEYGAEENYRLMFEMLSPMFVIAVISIFAVIIAGGMISTEVSSGTIKFWALTPNKRWKILTAKLLSILFYIIVITLVMSLLSVAFANIFFEEDGETYLYVKNGEVKEIGNTLYTVELYLAKAIPVVMFALFAVMLSTITRNTAASVSFSMALYMGNGIIMTIINSFIKKDWIRFVPFNNLNIADKIFTNSTNLMQMSTGGTGSFATSPSLGFSLGVLGICAILMIVTMYDSFNKRDII